METREKQAVIKERLALIEEEIENNADMLILEAQWNVQHCSHWIIETCYQDELKWKSWTPCLLNKIYTQLDAMHAYYAVLSYVSQPHHNQGRPVLVRMRKIGSF